MILLYHTVYPDSGLSERWSIGPVMTLTVFKRHILWLAKRYQMVSIPEYLAGSLKHGTNKRSPIALTFDDGFRITFDCVVPFLRENNIPATFFVSTGHLEHGELLWFSYLNALCFEKLYIAVKVDRRVFPLQTLEQCRQTWHALTALAQATGDPVGFSKMLAKTYPIPPDLSFKYEGMTHKQLIEAGRNDHLEIGGHTVTHPYLTQISRDMQAHEILGGKRVLSNLVGKPIRYFAYPSGEYNCETIELVKAADFDAAFAVTPKHLDAEAQFELGRVGIYSHSLIKLGMKAMGVAHLARQFGLHVG